MPPALSIIDQLSSARSMLDRGPLNARTLRAMRALQAGSPRERAVDGALNYIANLIVSNAARANVRFCEVTTHEDWRLVRELRKRCYPVVLPYLVNVLEPDGSDRHDRHSFVFAAFVDGVAVATIRATTHPYETLDYLDESVLARFLGDGWSSDYVEWGRLLVDRSYAKLRIMPALITYSGLRLMMMTPYRSYFGYTKPGVRKMISKFASDSDTLQFQIPKRGNHSYLMIKGSFSAAAVREIPKWLRLVGGRTAGASAAAQGVSP